MSDNRKTAADAERQLKQLVATLSAAPYAAVSVGGLLITLNSLRPLRGNWGFELLGLATILLQEFSIHHLAFHAALTALVARYTTALTSPLGKAAAAAAATNIAVLTMLSLQYYPTRAAMRKALIEYGLENPLADASLFPWRDLRASIFTPLDVRDPLRRVKRHAAISYDPDGSFRRACNMDWYHHISMNEGGSSSNNSNNSNNSADGKDYNSTPRPCLIFVHGGGWMSGNKRHPSGVALCVRMAALGWSCFSINYRLAPKHRFPAQIIDVKKAIAFIRGNSKRFNIDTSFVCLTGGSAGGHLSALAALSPNDVQYQRGFEFSDTSVQACIPFYGIYRMDPHDIADADGAAAAAAESAAAAAVVTTGAVALPTTSTSTSSSSQSSQSSSSSQPATAVAAAGAGGKPDVASLIVTASQDALQETLSNVAHFRGQRRRLGELWGKQIYSPSATAADRLNAMPFHRVKAMQTPVPPFFIIHGQNDTLVNVSHSRELTQELRAAGAAVALVEVPYAHHAFDGVQSLRTRVVLDGCRDWLLHVHNMYLVKNASKNTQSVNDNATFGTNSKGSLGVSAKL